MTISNSKSVLAALSLFALLALIPGTSKLFAAEPAPDPAASLANLTYYALGGSFVTNYDGAGRLKYLRTDISVRIDLGSAVMLDNHLPYIRNKMVVLLAAQIEENLTSTQGKEVLRTQALDEIKAALNFLEGGNSGERVRSLYFTTFVVQR
jgi:flagellar FliL protein